MRLRAAAETTRTPRVLERTALEPFPPTKSSSTEIAEPNFSTCDCARSRSSRNCWSASLKLAIVSPRKLKQPGYCRGSATDVVKKFQSGRRAQPVSQDCSNGNGFGDFEKCR